MKFNSIQVIFFIALFAVAFQANAGIVSLDSSNNYTFTYASGAGFFQPYGPNDGASSTVSGVNVEFALGVFTDVTQADAYVWTDQIGDGTYLDAAETGFRRLAGETITIRDLLSSVYYHADILYAVSYDNGTSNGTLPDGYTNGRSWVIDMTPASSQVSEPSVIALLSLGLIGLLSVKSRRQ